MRHLARVDANHASIVDLLRHCGAKVQSLANVGGGVPDILLCVGGKLALAEIKDGSKPPSKRTLTLPEQAWHEQWSDAPLYIIESDDDALRMLGELRGT